MEYIEYYHKERQPVKLVDKGRSWLMKAVGFILFLAGKMKLASIDNFVGGYVTTIGRSIYASPPWTNQTRVSPIVVHELTHVEQWSFSYALGYIFSPKYRMNAEAICVQAEALCFPDRFADDKYIEQRALHFVPYGVNFIQAVNILRVRVEEAKRGVPQKAASTIFELFKEWQKKESHQV